MRRVAMPVVVFVGMGIVYEALERVYPEPIAGNLTWGMLFLAALAIFLAVVRFITAQKSSHNR